MKKRLTLLLFVFIITGSNLLAQTIFASKESGSWAVPATVWETYPVGTDVAAMPVGTGSVTATVPSGTHSIYIRNGHTITMGGANRSCYNMTIESGGKLWANETSARRLQLANGGTGFTSITTTITNNGIIGGPTDGIFFEPGTNAVSITLTGTGETKVQRLRMPGGLAAGTVSFIIDKDITFTQESNYALSALYSPAATDNYTITINSNKTVTISHPAGYFHTNSSSSGTYTYNINGTLDLSASTQEVANLTAISPTGGATVNLNINGLLKTGKVFNSNSSAGTTNFTIGNGGIVDANLTTGMNFTNSWFKTNGTGTLKRSVANTDVVFPVGTNTSNSVILNNSGTASIVAVSVKNSFDHAPSDITKVINKQWRIVPEVGGANLAIGLGWSTADQAASFNVDNAVVIGRYGTSWSETAATVTGTSPYNANINNVTLFGDFAVGNALALPLNFLSFTAKPDALGKSVSLNWQTTNEVNTKEFIIEKRTDASEFVEIGRRPSNNTDGIHNYSYTDNNVSTGTAYYRLKQVDNDGVYDYSEIASADVKGNLTFSIYPNPTAEILNITHASSGVNTKVKVLSLDGKNLINSSVALGSTSTALDVSALNSGTYLVFFEGEKEQSALKFIKK